MITKPEKLLVILLIILVTYIGYYIFYPFNILEVEQPFETFSDEQIVIEDQEYDVFHIGENITFYIDYKYETDIPARMDRFIYCNDGNLVTLTPMEFHLPVGEGVIPSNYNEVVEKTSKNEICKLVFKVKFMIHNVLRVEQRTYETELFYVMD